MDPAAKASAPYPSGTVTLMFTDIVGSTELLRNLGPSYADALAEHRRVLREIFDQRGGREIDTQGDSFFVAFERASDALAAAGEAQSALQGDVRIRIGMHTGEPILTDEGYVGMDVHIAARIGAAGHGGQVLLSRATRELAGAASGVRDLGSHQLKGVGSVHLYQLGDGEFPRLASLDRTNLTARLAPLVGRDADIDQLVALLVGEHARLVTLTGPGGIGKTSLAAVVADRLLDDFADGVWFVDLAPVRDPALVAATIAAALGAANDPHEYLRDRQVLLLLDNFEHVIAAAGVVGRILEQGAGVSVITTSREPLRLQGEREYPVLPLGRAAAGALFRDRARAVLPSFDADSAQVAELGDRLEGIPLAIELAAARVKLLDPDQMLARLSSQLGLLTGGARDLPERQRTLETTIAWSFGLLDEDEQTLFTLLGVFAGRFTLEAAETVCDARLDTLQSLVDKSLVRSEDGSFSMFDSIREFAVRGTLGLADYDDLLYRHAQFYVELAERAEPELTGAHQELWLTRLGNEYENLRAALEWSSRRPEHVGEGLRIASSLAFYWFIRGPYREGINWLEPLLASSRGDRSRVRAGALWSAGLMWTMIGDSARALEMFEEALELAREQGDDSRIARTLDMMGLLAFFQNDMVGAREQFEASIAHARIAGDEWCLTDALATLGSIYPLQGEPQLATEAGGEALAIARRTGDQQGLRMALFGLALASFRQGRLDLAREFAEEGLGVVRDLVDGWFTPYFLWVLADVETAAGNDALALEYATESLMLARELDAPLMLVCALQTAAACARSAGDDTSAFALLVEAVEIAGNGDVPGSYSSTAESALAALYADRGDLEAAAKLRARALATARRVGDPWAASRATEPM